MPQKKPYRFVLDPDKFPFTRWRVKFDKKYPTNPNGLNYDKRRKKFISLRFKIEVPIGFVDDGFKSEELSSRSLLVVPQLNTTTKEETARSLLVVPRLNAPNHETILRDTPVSPERSSKKPRITEVTSESSNEEGLYLLMYFAKNSKNI